MVEVPIARIGVIVGIVNVFRFTSATTSFVKFSHVFLEIEVSTKTFPADLTGEWFFIIVCVHVEC